ncbi:MAG: fructosamine kinase family protein [Clostridia bacterium]|nr:fructosamine kinase family protein [Clostridia bacterium]
MKSKTKYLLNENQISEIFQKSKLGKIDGFYAMGAGEFNSVYCVNVGGSEYVLKIAPHINKKTLTYEKDMMRNEIIWYGRIGESTSIKIPKIFYYDFSKSIINADYFIMEKLNGEQMDKFSFDCSQKENPTSKLAKMAAEIHKIKNDKFGYEQNGLFDDWYQAIKTMTQNLIYDAKAVGHRSKRGNKLLGYIERYKEILKKADCSMVNFDLWSPNVICNTDELGFASYAWIDPERTFWGDKIADFVALEFGKPIEGKLQSIEAYNGVADEPIAITTEIKIRYYVASAYLALIQEVEKYYRYSIFNYGWIRNVFSANYLFSKAFKFLDNAKIN